MGANGRSGPVMSDWSDNLRVLRPVTSDWSGGVGWVCGMKRGISGANLGRVQVRLGVGTSTIFNWRFEPWRRGALEWWSSVDRSGPVIGGSDVQLRHEDSTGPTSGDPSIDEPVAITCSCC